jgi:hypothetical protein
MQLAGACGLTAPLPPSRRAGEDSKYNCTRIHVLSPCFLTSSLQPAPLRTRTINGGGRRCRPSTIHPRPTTLGWPFSLRYTAGARGLVPVPAASRVGLRAGSAWGFALSRRFFSPGQEGTCGEVRKQAKPCPYRTIGYARTDQAVGWDHWLPKRKLPTENETIPILVKRIGLWGTLKRNHKRLNALLNQQHEWGIIRWGKANLQGPTERRG